MLAQDHPTVIPADLVAAEEEFKDEHTPTKVGSLGAYCCIGSCVLVHAIVSGSVLFELHLLTPVHAITEYGIW